MQIAVCGAAHWGEKQFKNTGKMRGTAFAAVALPPSHGKRGECIVTPHKIREKQRRPPTGKGKELEKGVHTAPYPLKSYNEHRCGEGCSDVQYAVFVSTTIVVGLCLGFDEPNAYCGTGGVTPAVPQQQQQ